MKFKGFIWLLPFFIACTSTSPRKLVEKSKQDRPLWLQSRKPLLNQANNSSVVDLIFTNEEDCEVVTDCIVATRDAGVENVIKILYSFMPKGHDLRGSHSKLFEHEVDIHEELRQIALAAQKDLYFEGYDRPELPTKMYSYRVYIWFQVNTADWEVAKKRIISLFHKSKGRVKASHQLSQFVL